MVGHGDLETSGHEDLEIDSHGDLETQYRFNGDFTMKTSLRHFMFGYILSF